jgi:hypothetical protein
MFTLLTTVISFLAGNTPKFLEFFQQKSDQKHEIALAQLQMTQQLELQKAGFVAQKELEEIEFDKLKVQTASDDYKARISDINSARLNDTETSKGASTWVINLRSLVRPAITFGLFSVFLFIELFGCWYAYYNGVDFKVALDLLWDNETQIIWASIVGFYFGTR